MDLASLGFNIETAQVRMAETDLDNVTKAAERTEKAASRVEKAFGDMANSAQKLSNSSTSASTTIDNIAKSSIRNATAGDKLVQSLQQQINLYGKSADEVIKYVAAQAGVLRVVEGQLTKLNELGAAEAIRNREQQRQLAITKQVEAAQTALATSQYNFIESLRGQVQLAGMSSIELKKMEASMLGVSQQAAPLIGQLMSIAAAQEELAKASQLTSRQADFTANLQRQIETYGMGQAELRRYAAAQLGLTDTLASQLSRMDNLEQAQIRKNAADKAAANIAREVEAANASLERQRSSLLSELEKEIALYGKDALASKEYQASLLGISAEVTPLVTKLRELAAARKEAANTEAAEKSNAAVLKQATSEYTRMQAATASFVDTLRSKIELFDKDEAATLRYKASLQGISAIVEPLIVKYEALNKARSEKVIEDNNSAKIEQFNASLQRRIDLLGKNAKETDLYTAAELKAGQATFDLIHNLAALTAQRKADADATAAGVAAQKQMQSAQEQLINGLKRQITAFADDTLEAKRYEGALLGISHIINPLITDIKAYEQVKRDHAQGKKDQAFLDGLAQEVEMLGKDRFAILELQAAKRGLTNESRAYIQALRDAEEAGRAGLGLGAANLSARQLSQALRLLPAQITDIVTSLASGMPAWLVFIQQGGQLKDSFGGAGNAMKLLLGYLTPARLAIGGIAAVVAVLGAGFIAGNLEADKFNKTLTLVGEGLGVSSESATDMAHNIAMSTGSIGNASEVLNEFIKTGLFTSDTLQKIAQSAVDLERYAGKSISQTVAEFSSLAKDPVDASLRLNETYHFLTASVYEQIRALQTQGDTVAAANLAEETYANAMQQRSDELQGKLGIVQRAWLAVGDAAKNAWDKMLDIGREQTPEQKIERIMNQIEMIRANQTNFGSQSFGFSAAGGNAQLQILEAELQEQRLLRNEEILRTNAKRENQKLNDAAVQAMKEVLDWGEKGLTNEQKRNRALEIYEKRIQTIRQSGKTLTDDQVAQGRRGIEQTFKDIEERKKGLTLGQRTLENAKENNAVLQAQVGTSQTLGTAQKALIEYNVRLANIKKKDIKTADEQSLLATETATRAVLEQSAATESQIQKQKALSTLTVTSAQKALESAQQRTAVLEREVENGKALQSDAEKLIEFNQKIADIKNKSVLTADEKQLLAMETMLRTAYEHNATLGKQAEQVKEIAKFTERAAQIEATAQMNRNNRLEQYQRSLEGFGLGDVEQEKLKAENDIRREFAKFEKQLNDSASAGLLGSEQYNQQLEAQRKVMNESLNDMDNYYSQLGQKQADWKNGATRAFENYVAEGRNAANLIGNVFSNALTGMGDALANFATTGKADFKGLMTSILAELAKAEAKMAVSSLFSALGGLAGIGLSLGFGGVSSAVGVSGDAWANNTAYLASAKGNVFDSAGLHDYINTVVASPTTFKFAKGTGLMGEAGPEAIMPLVRGSDGNLGVRSSGGGGASEVNVQVNIDGSGQTTTSATSGYETFANEIGKLIEQKYRQLLSRDLKQGGTIRTALGRS